MATIKIRIEGDGINWKWSAGSYDAAGFAAVAKVMTGRVNEQSGREAALQLIERALIAARASLSDSPADLLAGRAGAAGALSGAGADHRTALLPPRGAGYAYACEHCNLPDAHWYIERRGDVRCTWSCDEHLGYVCNRMQRTGEKTELLITASAPRHRSQFGPVAAGLVTPTGEAEVPPVKADSDEEPPF